MGDLANKGNNLILIGFMGTGKTTIGRRVARSLDFEFIDTDQRIVEITGQSIPEIFKTRGESGFRSIETEVLRQCCEGSHRVISTGGGIVTVEENQSILESGGYVIWLKASPEVICERVSRNTERPLLDTADPEKRIRELLQAREDKYARCKDLTIVTDDLSVDETVYGITETARFWLLSGSWMPDRKA